MKVPFLERWELHGLLVGVNLIFALTAHRPLNVIALAACAVAAGYFLRKHQP